MIKAFFHFPCTSSIIYNFDCFIGSQSHTQDLSQTAGITPSPLVSMATAVIIQYKHIRENKETHQQCPVLLVDCFSPPPGSDKRGRAQIFDESNALDGLDGAQVEIRSGVEALRQWT